MKRRTFLGVTAAAGAAPLVAQSKQSAKKAYSSVYVKAHNDQFDPWIEVNQSALQFNVKRLSALAGGRKIMAVVKNNGYGLGDVLASSLIQDMPEIMGFASVTTDSCLAIRNGGIKKPVLLMAMTTPEGEHELAANNIDLAIYTDDASQRMTALAKKLGHAVNTHLYIDTGMSRMGMPYHRALPWVKEIKQNKNIKVQSAFMGFTEEPDYDREQLRRFVALAKQAKSQGADMGALHAASSNGVYHFPESHLDLVRPGISIYGAYPTYPDQEKKKGELEVAFRLQARVVRVEKLRKDDSVSYGRKYIAKKPTWVATIPIGHADGYPRKAVKGAKILIGGNLYPVIGAVSASHCIVELGETASVKIGDVATLIGPDHPEIHPSHISTTTEVSVYDILMHLSSRLPKRVV